MQPFYVPDFIIKVEGLTLASDVSSAIIDLTYDNNLDTADMFTLQLNNAGLRLTDSALFDVGKDVEIHMGYAGRVQPMMLGEIMAVSPSFPQNGAPTLTITGYDKSHRMRHNTPARFTFKFMDDSAIAAQIAVENLLIPLVDPPLMPPRESIQQTGSDWALLQELADRNFYEVFVNWNTLYFRAPRPQTEMVVLEWGKSLSRFSPRLSTAAQAGIQVVRSYDQELAQTIVAILPSIALGTDLDNIIERLGSSFVNQLIGFGRHVIRDQPVGDYLEATVLAKSILSQLMEGLYEGRGSCIGNPRLRAGDMIDIRGIGKRFSGTYRLRKVSHAINDAGYQTTFEVSQKYTSTLLQSLRDKIGKRPAPNEQQKVYGVVVGEVENNVDPKGLGRVQVSFPHLSDKNLSRWAPLATLMAGSESGTYFLPDRKDQVLVAFTQGDINSPVVLGSLWDGRHRRPPARHTDGQNRIRLIKTNAGHTITFDDTSGKERLVITDKAGQTITLDSTSGKEQIAVRDKAGSMVTLHPDGKVSIEAAGDLELKAGGNVKIDATRGDVDIDTNNVNVKVSGAMDVS